MYTAEIKNGYGFFIAGLLPLYCHFKFNKIRVKNFVIFVALTNKILTL